MIEQLLDPIDAHSALALEIKDHSGIERAAARAHRQPIERGEPHCGVDALPVAHGAKAGPGAEMGDDDPSTRHARVSFAQGGSDVVVGKPVEAVAPDPGVMQFARQPKALRDLWLVMMEGGVEAGDLRQ